MTNLKKKEKISIIIRTKNEERWIESCINSINQQKKVKFEIIIVDNFSTDKTVLRAKKFPVKIIKIKKYLPGKALNLGIKKATGSIIVCLSAHCIPCDDMWLYNLTREINKKNLAGIYGRQVPLPYSSDNDKRDLLNTFGLDKKIQKKDSFFHNACSAFKKSLWKKYKFDDNLTNIEDRVWAYNLIKKGYFIIYEPKSRVYHWHGIHQNLDSKRGSQVVKILESLGSEFNYENFKKSKDIKVNLIIPHRGKSKIYKDGSLLQNCIEHAKFNKLLTNIYVFADNKKVFKSIPKEKKVYPIFRSKKFSEDHIDLLTAAQNCLKMLEAKKIFSDYVIVTTEIFPKKELYFFDKLINFIHKKNLDIVFPIIKQKGFLWKKNIFTRKSKMLANGFEPTKLKNDEIILSRPGYGFIIRPELLRLGSISSDKIGFIKIANKNNFQEL
tara:strand:+ start:475 stop:1794 length:1320 start_codon:yes stop_codon:yes gene_type:complete